MHINRGLLFWGLALVTAGVVALAAAQGWLDIPVMVDLWNYWPVILIVIGLAIVLSRTPFAVIGVIVAALVVGFAAGAVIAAGPGFTSCGDVQGSQDTASGEFTAASGRVNLDMNCGDLTVALADGSAWQAVTTTEDGQSVSLTATADSLDISSNTGGFPFSHDRQDWTITLGREVEYDASLTLNAAEGTLDLTDGDFASLEAHPNAGSLRMDLGGSAVSGLDIQLNAGSLSLLTDAGTQLAGRIGVNAGSVELCTDPEAGIRITVDANVSFAHNLDDSGLQKSGEGTYTSANFDSTAGTIDLQLEGNAASFTLNPEEGCA